MSADTLRRTPGTPGADLAWAGPVHAETARRLACDASLTPIVTDVPDGTPLSRITADVTVTPLAVGDTRRTINPSLRRAITVRDRGCRFPGCDRPPEWTDGHHVRHWADHGPPRLDNLVLLCRYHHRRIHEGGWSVRWNPDGSLVTVPP